MSECTGPDCPLCAAERASGGGNFHEAAEHIRRNAETARLVAQAKQAGKTMHADLQRAALAGQAGLAAMAESFERAAQPVREFTLCAPAPLPDIPVDPPRPAWMGAEHKGGGMRSKSTRNTGHRPGGKAQRRKAQRAARKKGR